MYDALILVALSWPFPMLGSIAVLSIYLFGLSAYLQLQTCPKYPFPPATRRTPAERREASLYFDQVHTTPRNSARNPIPPALGSLIASPGCEDSKRNLEKLLTEVWLDWGTQLLSACRCSVFLCHGLSPWATGHSVKNDPGRLLYPDNPMLSDTESPFPTFNLSSYSLTLKVH